MNLDKSNSLFVEFIFPDSANNIGRAILVDTLNLDNSDDYITYNYYSDIAGKDSVRVSILSEFFFSHNSQENKSLFTFQFSYLLSKNDMVTKDDKFFIFKEDEMFYKSFSVGSVQYVQHNSSTSSNTAGIYLGNFEGNWSSGYLHTDTLDINSSVNNYFKITDIELDAQSKSVYLNLSFNCPFSDNGNQKSASLKGNARIKLSNKFNDRIQ
jgi:hypothetical protein